MSYKIQITVDEKLNKTIKAQARAMGLSVSAFARVALMRVILKNNKPLLEQALDDIKSENLKTLSLDDFNKQIDEL